MSSKDHVKNIAIVGASGLVGGEIFRNVLERGTFNVTAISRQESNATFPPGVTVKKGDYASSNFLESALEGQDVLIITLSVMSSPDIQTGFIRAAAKAGVPWILPNEYGGDGANEELSNAVPILSSKRKYRALIEELGRSSWIGIASNLWIDFGLKGGWFSIDIPSRKGTIYDDGTNPIVTTTVPQVGRAVARLLSLPVHSSSSPSLSEYKNQFAYIRSFSVSQNDMLSAVQRATHTKQEDWHITKMPVDDYIRAGSELLAEGNRMGMMNILYGSTFKRGLGDQYHGRELANEKLGLEDEDLDEVVERVVKEMERK